MTSLILLFLSKMFHVAIAAMLQKAVIASRLWWCRILTTGRNVFEVAWVGVYAHVVVTGGIEGTVIGAIALCAGALFGIEAGVRLGDHFLKKSPKRT